MRQLFAMRVWILPLLSDSIQGCKKIQDTSVEELLLRFRRLLTSYGFRFRLLTKGSGSGSYLDHKKNCLNFFLNLAFLHRELFYKEKIDKFQFIKFIVKCT